MASRSATSFGELLKRMRLACGLSQETLAERARMSASAIGALERGARRAPYRDTVALLAAALELTDVERAELEAVADRARGRQSRTDAEPPEPPTLPTRLTSFLGRDREIAEIEALLEVRRLVTITGSGGIGKTRTAVEVAKRLLREQQSEIWFVDLSPLDDGALVAGTIAAALRIPLSQVADSARLLAAKLKARKLLLILDNCEHVIDEVARVAGPIVRGCPGVKILATSRERLAIEGERAYRLPSLPVPEKNPQSVAEACSYASFRLFMERATAIEPNLTFDATRLRASAEISTTRGYPAGPRTGGKPLVDPRDDRFDPGSEGTLRVDERRARCAAQAAHDERNRGLELRLAERARTFAVPALGDLPWRNDS